VIKNKPSGLMYLVDCWHWRLGGELRPS